MIRIGFKTLSVALVVGKDNAPPTEFRLFTKGWNETTKGKFLFDDASAQAVMAAYEKHGVDLAIDLEHQMLGDPSSDPTARDARGWCRLALRNGELWAVEVRWTPDGARRLSEGTQRYVSPAFEIDPKSGRILDLLNIAITAMPATHKTPALVAASKGGGAMDPQLVKQALDAVEKGDAKAALEILKGLIASAAGAEPEPDGDEGGSEGDGAEGMPAMDEASQNASPPADGGDASSAPEDGGSDDGKDKKKMSELLSQLSTMIATLSKEKSDRETEERRQLCASLVKLGAEFPSTVWENSDGSTPKKRWADMPIAELRSHVKEQQTARGGRASNVRVPAQAGPQAVTLSEAQRRICEETGCKPEDFARLQRMRDSGEDYVLQLRARENLVQNGKVG